ncbi:Na+/H+ antiporter NhaA [Microlunatus sp. Gsoil 973]|jgi:hypothetical protein|uniref:Na+/H+ antiporter NhaA n=1 Tax=Microlunatus sp. Gsoil 973 TaxID=2672569 RepID=UPI0012B4FD3E|nr:Na+/H+ antiporter NhaA [Microlunatus sp. Gsoil 973]QGN34436.1 hypothetical protein GJV80_18245 [Microlunatus sp. Gsoil 973]
MTATTADPATDTAAQSPWTRRHTPPLRAFLQTESGSGGLLLGAVVAALVWANVAQGSYDQSWQTRSGLTLGDVDVTHDLRIFSLRWGLVTRTLLARIRPLRHQSQRGLPARSRLGWETLSSTAN